MAVRVTTTEFDETPAVSGVYDTLAPGRVVVGQQISTTTAPPAEVQRILSRNRRRIQKVKVQRARAITKS